MDISLGDAKTEISVGDTEIVLAFRDAKRPALTICLFTVQASAAQFPTPVSLIFLTAYMENRLNNVFATMLLHLFSSLLFFVCRLFLYIHAKKAARISSGTRTLAGGACS